MAIEPKAASEAKAKAVGEMNKQELQKHIDDLDAAHKSKMKHLRALLRCVEEAF